MDYQCKSVVYGADWLATQIAAVPARAAAALVVAGKLRLSTDPNFTALPGTTIADLAAFEGAYSGYTPGGYAVTFTAQINITAQITGLGVRQLFLATAATPFVGETITAWWFDDGTNVVVQEKLLLPGPWAISGPGDFLQLLAYLPYPYYVGGLSA